MKPDQTFKLTGDPVSPALQAITNRLAKGHPVQLQSIMETPEVSLAEQIIANSSVSTDKMDQRPRRPMQTGILRKLNSAPACRMEEGPDGSVKAVYDAPVEHGKRIDFVLGLPASGKSSALAEPISAQFLSRIIDSDEVKEMIPEFNNGWGAGAVHKESKMIAFKSFQLALDSGENIVIPKIGEPPDSVISMMRQAKAYVYEVGVHMMELDCNKSLGRALERFVTTGRYIPVETLADHMSPDGKDKMRESFDAIVARPECDCYSLWSNDVPFGEAPILIESKGMDGTFLDRARTDVHSIPAIEREDPDTVLEANLQIRDIIEGNAADPEARAKQQEQAAAIRHEIGGAAAAPDRPDRDMPKNGAIGRGTPGDRSASDRSIGIV